jgi:hypothetical protein
MEGFLSLVISKSNPIVLRAGHLDWSAAEWRDL